MLINFYGGVGKDGRKNGIINGKVKPNKLKFPEWNIDDIAIAVFDC